MPPDRHGEIAKRAYSIWELEGRPSGRDLDLWLRAEAEVQAEAAKPAPEPTIEAERAKTKRTAPAKPQRPAARRTGRTQ